MMTAKMHVPLFLHSLAACGLATLLILFGLFANHKGLSEGLFVAVPFLTGFAIPFIARGNRLMAVTTITSLMVSLSILLLAGLEGVGCVVMAFPLLFVSIGVGVFAGHFVASRFMSRYASLSAIVVCIGGMMLSGFTFGERSPPELLVVETRMSFHAPMEEVWDSVRVAERIAGNDFPLRTLGLPVPYRCTVSPDGNRVCFFEEGEMIQSVTKEIEGSVLNVDVVECTFVVRDWLSFVDAGYRFIQRDGYVEVVRTSTIASDLQPRWYWSWFEEQCVQLEHDYVMSSMRRDAESAPR